MSDKIYIYMKQGEDISKLTPILDRVSPDSEPQYDIYTDSNRDFIAYHQLKKDLLKKKGILVITSINNIAPNKNELYNELMWLKNNRIKVIFADYPSTCVVDNPIASAMILSVIIEIYAGLLNNKSFEIIPPTAAPTGRKKITFPDNWGELYTEWVNEKITSKEFMSKTGLKKGTFYHLIQEYKDLVEMNNGTISV